MQYVTTTDHLAKLYGVPQAVRRIAAAGFDGYDFSVFDITEKNPLYRDGWRDYIADIRHAADACGIRCMQSHAPFPTSKTDTPENAPYNDRITDCVLRAMEAAAMLGANVIVVHPKQHLDYSKNEKYLFDLNMDYYRSLLPYAKRFGIRVAAENMWQYRDGHCVDSTCSRAEEFAAYIDTVGDEYLTACLDLGHCGLCGYKAADMIRALGADRLGALHVHDNDGIHDSHTVPFGGVIRWRDVSAALRDIGYRGTFTYEADHYLAAIPESLIPHAMRYMLHIAKSLCEDM